MATYVISDVHGNYEALTTVLKDIENRNIKNIYCLGDIIAKGVHPSECLTLIKEKCQVILRGNCEEILLGSIEDCTGLERARRIWNQSMLTEEEKNFLLNLPYCHEFYMSGSLIRMFHSHPEEIIRMIANIDTIESKKSLFMPSINTITSNVADIIIYGHLHLPYLDKIYNRTIINVGSVGNSIDIVRNDEFDANTMEITQAYYTIIKGNIGSKEYDSSLSIQFVRVPYNIKKELNSSKTNIEKDSYEKELTKGKYRDTKRLIKSLKQRNININKF
jgi:protein phosphatase